jgi:hypothetical protein
VLDRFSITSIALDHHRSLRDVRSGRPDWAAHIVLRLAPLAVLVTVVLSEYRLPDPSALLPATSLLAGVLFAAVGQLISIRARIADSVVLSNSARLRAHFRESISGMLLAALGALGASTTLAVLAQMPATPDVKGDPTAREQMLTWAPIAMTALSLMMLTFVVLMFVSASRRLYTSYLEAFEGGHALSRRNSTTAVARAETTDSRPDDRANRHPMTPVGDGRSRTGE